MQKGRKASGCEGEGMDTCDSHTNGRLIVPRKGSPGCQAVYHRRLATIEHGRPYTMTMIVIDNALS